MTVLWSINQESECLVGTTDAPLLILTQIDPSTHLTRTGRGKDIPAHGRCKQTFSPAERYINADPIHL